MGNGHVREFAAELAHRCGWAELVAAPARAEGKEQRAAGLF